MPTIRLIAGRFGGRKLDAPESSNRRTHPMGERVRNAICNSLVSKIQGANVLDAFAGTGALGLEALSRGAATVTFIEKDRIALKILGKNIGLLGAEGETTVIPTTVNNWVDTRQNLPAFDIVFADPPYYNVQIESLKRLCEVVADDGTMIVSWPAKTPDPMLDDMELIAAKEYASARILTYIKKAPRGGSFGGKRSE